jgi:hypothetical protein
LLSSTEKSRAEPDSGAHQQQTNPYWTVEFMRAGCQSRHTQFMEMDWEAADSLYSVGMDRDAPRRSHCGQGADRLDRASLIVG